MRKVLKYGNSSIQIEIPEITNILRTRDPRFDIDKPSFCQSLANTLPDDSDSYKKVAVIVGDKTRLCGYPVYLPWIIDSLLGKGVLKNNITFYIAYGVHPRQTDDESVACYGNSYRLFKFVHHDCRESVAFSILGQSTQGTPVAIRKDILESTLLITFGAISHHYFAGYGGGRKLLFPGLGRMDAIYHNHSLFLDRSNKELARNCQPGNLEGNPLAEDLEEIDNYLPSKISVHGILNSRGKVCKLLVGRNYKDFINACRIHDGYYRASENKQYDLVIASGGGYPKDINFIQAHKSLHHAAAFVKDSGTLILLAECSDGLGSEHLIKHLLAGGFKKTFEILENNYEGNGGTALSLMTKTSRIKVFLKTSLDEATCEKLNVTKIDTEDLRRIIATTHSSMAVIQNASLLVY
jgi:lactate racemase